MECLFLAVCVYCADFPANRLSPVTRNTPRGQKKAPRDYRSRIYYLQPTATSTKALYQRGFPRSYGAFVLLTARWFSYSVSYISATAARSVKNESKPSPFPELVLENTLTYLRTKIGPIERIAARITNRVYCCKYPSDKGFLMRCSGSVAELWSYPSAARQHANSIIWFVLTMQKRAAKGTLQRI
jgi:hypothetical protein